MWCSSASASASDDIASIATAPPSAARKPLRSMSIGSSQGILLERSHTLDFDPRIVDKPACPKRASSRHAFLLEEGPVNGIHVSPLLDVRQHHRALDDVVHRRPVLIEHR